MKKENIRQPISLSVSAAALLVTAELAYRCTYLSS